MARFLAICGWLAWTVCRPFRAVAGRRVGGAPALVLATVLAVLAVLPLVVPLFDPQPEDVTVQQIFDRTTTHPDGWVRLRGRIQPLEISPTGERGRFALLIDAVNPLRAVVVSGDLAREPAASAVVTGHLVDGSAVVDEELPIEATVAGTPPRVAPDRLVRLDAAPRPLRVVSWPLSILPALLAAMLVAGVRVGYPVFQSTSEIDVLANPLAPGERVPTAFGGRIGPTERHLADPGGALLLVRRGPRGTLLTAQALADDAGVAPPPVTIGGSWTSGRIGVVHTVRESVSALRIRSELVDATFLFSRRAERDRVAALVSVER